MVDSQINFFKSQLEDARDEKRVQELQKVTAEIDDGSADAF